jgi:CBS domain-containing protein
VLGRLSLERAVEPAVLLRADTPLAETAATLLEHDAHEGLIVEDGRLVGILTHTDLLRALMFMSASS